VADPAETTQIGRPPAPDESSSPETSEVLGAIHELAARVGELQTEVQTLRAETRALPAGREAAGWDDPRSGGPDLLTWVRDLDSPPARGPAVPRLLLEIMFLVAVAVAVAIAELEAVEIAAVMTGAWVLVVVAELAGARAARRRAEAVYAPLPGLSAGFATDQAWFAPPIERTVLDVADADEEDTGEHTGGQTSGHADDQGPAKLPPPSHELDED
jgi:uncharacterized small protein (DUF1192 family)